MLFNGLACRSLTYVLVSRSVLRRITVLTVFNLGFKELIKSAFLTVNSIVFSFFLSPSH